MIQSFTPASFFAALNKIQIPAINEMNENVRIFKTTGCRKAHDACVTAMLPMVYNLAVGRRGIAEVDDMFQQGALAVMDALRMFDFKDGLNILSWTKLYVSRAINSHCVFGTKLIRVPETKTIRLCYRRMGLYLKEGPITETRSLALAKELGVSLEDFKIARDLYSSSFEPMVSSSDEPWQGHEITTGETLEDAIIVEDEAIHVTKVVGRLMSVLNPKESEVIRLRCLQEEPVQLRLVGEQLGFSTERARQVENLAKDKMRKAA
ncbi:sigma factor-like helix-turn-helix DNA-binding protein [Pseudomonas sp. CFBP 13719]|uniref:sigma factor-like helix-turn-helix DNA-binding protein n=1 Tax=Pseudomonas sp. CFBP 13719 TaxID=2775303 RepID=UPI00178294B4|nr:sigma factor-like helix-turn-helix DNA-binding protein [Pseudomonas sp. CFBP 13719]MBD8614936.1 alternative sigma factor RpoH [Pseudomonas putida]MBD8681379.1 alternative sigma factor RpoH [Pseudomonas sp. CFBP 13719]